MSGAGIYAVKQIAKTADNRYNNRPANEYRQSRYIDDEANARNSYSAQPSGQVRQEYQMQLEDSQIGQQRGYNSQFEDHRRSQQQGQMAYLNNEASAALPPGYSYREEDPRFGYAERPMSQQQRALPHYQRGYVEPEEVIEPKYSQGQREGGSGMAMLNSIAGMAIGGGDKSGGKGKEALAKFFK